MGFASTGPRSIERGVSASVAIATLNSLASTGPRSIERGVTVQRVPNYMLPPLLQRGRAQLSAEWWRPISASASGRCCFNGAALN